MQVEVFRSKVDRWVAVVPLAGIGGVVGMTALGGRDGMVVGLIGIVFMLVLVVAVVLPLRYELHDDALVIRFGLFRSRVPYERIFAVTPSDTWLASPALSLDRLHVDAGSPWGPNISPKDKLGFLAALARRTPHLQLVEDRLIPPEWARAPQAGT